MLKDFGVLPRITKTIPNCYCSIIYLKHTKSLGQYLRLMSRFQLQELIGPRVGTWHLDSCLHALAIHDALLLGCSLGRRLLPLLLCQQPLKTPQSYQLINRNPRELNRGKLGSVSCSGPAPFAVLHAAVYRALQLFC